MEDCLEGCPPCLGCCSHPPEGHASDRRRAWALTGFTIAWNTVEGAIALISGVLARSIALVGFGLDSVIETASACIIVWRLSRRGDDESQSQAERRAVRLIALSLWAVAAYVGAKASADLLGLGERAEQSPLGLAVLALSLAVMTPLVWAKRRVALRLGSVALEADAAQTMICLQLSAVVLVGLAANALLGWWWADPMAALAVAGVAAREGWEAWESARFEEAAGETARCPETCCLACPAPA